MLVLLGVCIVFSLLIIREYDAKTAEIFSGKKESAVLLTDTILEGASTRYTKRIIAFTDPNASKSRMEMIRAFAEQDREKLLAYSFKLLRVLKKENPYFATIGWVLPDNRVFLRTHNPESYDDNVVAIRKDVVFVNAAKLKKTVSGFYFGKQSMQYRIVHPVFFNDHYIGLVQFGLNSDFIVDALQRKLHAIAGMAVLVTRNNKPLVKVDGKYRIYSQEDGLFVAADPPVDWSLPQQQIRSRGKSYILLDVLPLLSFSGDNLGHFFVALDSSSIVSQKRQLLITVIVLSATVLCISFIILFLSFGALIQKILDLNVTLERTNLELEDRVRERTLKIKESEQRLQKILDNSPVGILIAAVKSREIIYANPAVCKMLGYDKEKMEQLAIVDLHPPEEIASVFEKFEEQYLGQRVAALDVTFLAKDGSEFEADIISNPMVIDGCDAVVGFIVDRSNFKQLVKQLHRAQKMEAIGLMAGGVAHDLNNILSGVVSYPELLLMELPTDSSMREPLIAIQDSGKRAAAVVADMLTVARGVAITRKLHDINELICSFLKSPEWIKIKSRFPDLACEEHLGAEDSVVSCSSVHIQKSIMNLVLNAAEAAGEEGNVLISTANQLVADSESTHQQIPSGYYLVITVEDDGPGIEDADIDHIFEPFYTKKKMGRSGTGLGLSVVWNTMQDHNGVVLVDNLKQGSRFQLFLPANPDEEGQEDTEEGKGAPVGHGEKILVVDDEPQLRDIATQILESLAYQVESVCSGEQAITFLENNTVDLIVLDMMMEPGMNGRLAYEKIISKYPTQKAIIATGFSESSDVGAVLKMGACGFIKKPYSIEDLAEAVHGALAADSDINQEQPG